MLPWWLDLYISGVCRSICVWTLLFNVIVMGHMPTVSKIFIWLRSQLCLRQLAPRWAWKMTLMKDSQKDSRNVSTCCTRNSSCTDSDIGIGSWSVSTYRRSMYSAASATVTNGPPCEGRNLGCIWALIVWPCLSYNLFQVDWIWTMNIIKSSWVQFSTLGLVMNINTAL